MFKLRSFARYCFLVVVISFLFGCAGPGYVRPRIKRPEGPGFYHRATKGQTLWRISKIYGTDLDQLVKINRISNASSISVGQLIFVPRAESVATKIVGEDFIWPLRGRVIARFGQETNNAPNKGIDIKPYSNNDVMAARSGKVVFYSDDFAGLGKILIIDHLDGYLTVYGRNSRIFVKAGDEVRRGKVIARAGSAGRDAGKVYLHFQVRKGHIPQNPYFYLPRQ
ncbi:murein hydrolase activator EnvC family protein [Candidatus Omnitrophota bacterium]